MRSTGRHSLQLSSLASVFLGLTLVAVPATPAHAQSVRAQQWHLDAMRASEMWKISTGQGITVAVIDSGVDDSLADLKGQVLDGKDFSEQRGDEHTDVAGHGTDMAALIAGTGKRGPQYGSYGLAPGSKILPIRMRYASDQFGQVDSRKEFSRALTAAIRYAADSKAQIINMSLGNDDSPGRQDVGTPELASAVKYALSKGKLLFAAVGNNGEKANRPEYPASTPGVVGIAAADKNAKVGRFSQWGPEVDMMAPGIDMVHACLGGSEICKSRGTSDATAIASASAALIWSKHPDWTNNQVLRVMLNTLNKPADGSKRSDLIGYGGIRPRAALLNPGDPGPADVYPLPDLAAAAAKSPSPESPKPTAPAKHEEAAPKSADGGGSTLLWTGVGVAAALVVGAAAAFAVFRSRRRTGTTPPPPPAYPPYVPAQSPHQPPADSHHRSEKNP
ncbi:type VII secretion-associated serine protease mycosin [Streptomyces sp. SID4982]|uniref:type VII secretion-associated serine protease mycosin n=1 Tax=Streptomyces sp. SID4982 TaxID=2690291 RepID=UPI0013709CBD|nr:type VII secretion-associated serine protease mycosin [Streptomyces sp. SID4982]MYS18328.1 type VII secretion-associated serine protease mycosin [Streptomyces sp. SID4982]